MTAGINKTEELKQLGTAIIKHLICHVALYGLLCIVFPFYNACVMYIEEDV